jgi:hypothetical protein
VSGPVRRRFIFPGGGLGAHFRLQALSAGKFGPEKGDGTRADSSMLAASGVSTVRSRTPGLGLSRESETGDSCPPGVNAWSL